MMRLTEPQRKKLRLMRYKDKILTHYFNDHRFTFSNAHNKIEHATGTALILSGHLVCVEQNKYNNVWKAK